MPEERRIWLPIGSLRLEGALAQHGGQGRRPAAVVCHPHPRYGGDMDNNVVLGLRDSLVEAGVSVLRFNFRGVGRSEGRYGEGIGERDDVRAAIDALASDPGVLPERILLVGYSFGAWVGLPAGAADPRVGGLVAVAPPLALWPMDDLSQCSSPKLVVVGGRDAYCPLDLLDKWFTGLRGPKERAVVPEADHFFWSHERELGWLVAGYAARWASGGVSSAPVSAMSGRQGREADRDPPQGKEDPRNAQGGFPEGPSKPSGGHNTGAGVRG